MIFNTNSTVLGNAIPMAEGYDSSTGFAMALIESARNEYAMFEAMLNVEAKEIQIENSLLESGNRYSEMVALNEAASKGILERVKELFTKLVAKLKAILHNFIARINSLIKSDGDLVRKYEKEIKLKRNLDKLMVKWNKRKDVNTPLMTIYSNQLSDLIKQDYKGYGEAGKSEDKDERYANVLAGKFGANKNSLNLQELEDDIWDFIFEDKDRTNMQLSETGTDIMRIMDFLKNYSKNLSKFESEMRKNLNKIEGYVRKASTDIGKLKPEDYDKPKNDDGTTSDKSPAEEARYIYDGCVAFNDVIIKIHAVMTDMIKEEYKQNKSAFMKAITASDKKLEESFVNFVIEAAEDEVEDAIDSAIETEIIDVCDSETELLSGDEDSDVDESTVSESAFFSALLY